MRNILIGSRALDYWHDAGLVKDTTDWDVVSTSPIKGTEWHDRWILNNDVIGYFTSPEHTIMFNGQLLHVCSLQGLAAIKRSHLWRDLGFGKHITMYHGHLSRYLDLNDEFTKIFLSERTKQTLEKFPQQGPNLKKTVEEFFDDAVDKKYSHDWLHELYAFEDKPMYTKMQTNPEIAWCDKQLWDGFTHEQKIHTVQEETYVICTERFLVPKDFKYPAKLGYNKALNKVCTTLCSGWFRNFAIDNYPEILDRFDESKVQLVQQIIERK
jgi:hypothetical protein